MSTLLTPPASDTRTPKEYTYDMLKTGAIYDAPAAPTSSVAANKLIATLMELPDDRQDIAALGLEMWLRAQDDKPLPDHLTTAYWASRYEMARQKRAAEETVQSVPPKVKLPDEPCGELADGTPIMGSYEEGKRSGVVSVELPGWYVDADDTGFLSLGLQDDAAGIVELRDVTLEQVNALRALLATDAIERLLSAARAWT